MPISTDLNVSPYHDDYDESKNYSKVMFRPGVSVQVRELNQLQTMLQKQIERFGDSIYKRGTIVNGCQFIFHQDLPYVKLKDTDTDGAAISVTDFVGKLVKNETGLKGYVIDALDGFEAADPDLNTLFVRYINSGDSQTATAFASAEVLTVYDGNNSVESIKITGGGSLFSNADAIVVLPAIEIQNTTGGVILPTSFTVGETITQSTTGAKANVVSVNTTVNSSAIIVKLKPLSNNLANGLNTTAWSFSTGYTITGGTSGATANVTGLVGSNAAATLITGGSGILANVNVTNGGTGYYVEPYISVAAANNTGNTTAIGLLSLDGRNYISKVAVSTVTDRVGTGYGFTVTDGVIYQKGYFSKVNQQMVIVDSYSNTPHQLVVGFDTIESIINSNSDSTLLDNSTGTFNTNAPGANRLKLEPTLVVLPKDEAQANDEFFALVEFAQGKPFKQFKTPQYSELEDEMARRTREESGNYVLDQFFLTTRSPNTVNSESTTFDIVIDPGLAYISGRRVQSVANYSAAVNKATNTSIIAGNAVDMDYGNYIEVNEVGGTFNFALGGTVSIRDTANTYLTSYPGTDISSGPGTEIGTARIRSMTYVDGSEGSPTARYRLYLFDIRMVGGKNFRNARAFFYDGANKGVADVITTVDATTGSSIAALQEVNKAKLLFPTKTNATKTLSPNGSSANISYIARFSKNNASLSATGSGGNLQQQITISNTGYGYFPYSGALTDNQKRDIVIIPQSNTQAAANLAGSVTITGGQTNAVGTSTDLVTALAAGDYIKVANSTAFEIRRVAAITNATHVTVSQAFTNAYSGANVALYFPQLVPIPFVGRSTRTASVSSNTTLYLGLGVTLNISPTATVYYNQTVETSPSAVVKTAKRKAYVKLRANTNLANTVGPWCLGIPDIFRLRNVYVANDVNVNVNSTVITNEFYVDHNQTEDFYDVGYLYKKPGSTYTVGADAVLLAEFDVFTKTANGVTAINSYPINDTLSLANADVNASNSTINILELPEMYGKRGDYYDLRDQVDFRLYASNTANISLTSAAATTNPVEPTDTARFDTTSQKYFPAPQEDLKFDVEFYIPRKDRVVLDANGDFIVIGGKPGDTTNPPPQPSDSITINILDIPAYPSVPSILSSNTILITDTKIANEKYTTQRRQRYTVSLPISQSQVASYQPKGYTMSDIGSLDRRIQNLEYYVQLTLAESAVKDRVITSSGNSAINRFKFGFFVDSFDSKNYSDTANPAYKATVMDGQLSPRKKQRNIPMIADPAGANSRPIMSLPYVEAAVVSQLTATDGAVVLPVVNSISNTVTVPTTNTTQSTICVGIQNVLDSYTANAETIEISEFTLSANNGTAKLSFDMLAGNDRIEIYQNTSPGFDYTVMTPLLVPTDAVVLTASDRSTLTQEKAFINFSGGGYLDTGAAGLARSGPWDTSNRPDFSLATGPSGLGSPANYWLKNAGKFEWTHVAANGRYYKVVVKKGSPAFCYQFCYPGDANTVVTTTSSPPPSTNYRGSFVVKSPDVFNLHSIINPASVVAPTQQTYGPIETALNSVFADLF